MSVAEHWDDASDGNEGGLPPERLTITPDVVEVRRNGGLSALVGAAACGVAIAYLARASETASALDWSLAVMMGLLGVGYLRSFVDARTPLLVADAQGVRIRLGRAWRGLPWSALSGVAVVPRTGPLRDGLLVLTPHNPDRVLAELDPAARRQSRVAERLHGAPFAVPLGVATRVTGTGEQDLRTALEALADGASVISSPQHDEDDEAAAAPRWRDPRPALAHAIGVVSARLPRGHTAEEPDAEEPDAQEPDAEEPGPRVSETPEPLRPLRAGRRAESRREAEPILEAAPAPEVVGSQGAVGEETSRWTDRVRPIARRGEAVEPLVVEEIGIEAAEDPVIGPELAAARTRLALSVDQLADRTRIRPHVIESIEVDDFVPCGGDFYARGHLRTLARVLGVDVAPLLTAYDERYAHAPIDPRRVFEAELATTSGGSIRGTRGGPNWSVLIAAIMTVVLVWSIARLLMDTPVELQQPAPVLNGSAGVGSSQQSAAKAVPVVLKAVQGGATVVVRDGTGSVVFEGDIAHGASKRLDVVPPVRVESSDAGAVETHVAGKNRGTLGESGAPGRGTFIVR